MLRRASSIPKADSQSYCPIHTSKRHPELLAGSNSQGILVGSYDSGVRNVIPNNWERMLEQLEQTTCNNSASCADCSFPQMAKRKHNLKRGKESDLRLSSISSSIKSIGYLMNSLLLFCHVLDRLCRLWQDSETGRIAGE